MAAATPLSVPARRRLPRYQLAIPVEVTVLRSGIPQTLPGRSVDLGPGGMAVVLAGDLYPGESVGIELQLPGAPETLQAKARVCYQDRIRSGVGFVTPSAAKIQLIQTWAHESRPAATSTPDFRPAPPPAEPQFLSAQRPELKDPARKQPRGSHGQKILLLLAVLASIGLVGFFAYRQFPRATAAAQPQAADSLPRRVIVPSDAMRPLITYRTVPLYPEAARLAGVEGIVVLDAIIGRDGRVLEVRALNGPGELVGAAADAVRNWRFSPFTLNGDAVEVETTIEVGFRLSDR